jgi:hypothetical protein
MSGDSDPYDDGDLAALAGALADALADFDSTGTVTMTVEAQVEWNGTIARNARGGVRSVRFTNVNTAGIRAAMSNLGGPKKSYKAKTPEARLHQLQRTKSGRQALADAGYAPPRSTAGHHARGRKISGKYVGSIDAAYAAQSGQTSFRSGLREVGDAMTAALDASESADIRFRDIRDLKFWHR